MGGSQSVPQGAFQYSYIVPGSETEKTGAIHRNPEFKDELRTTKYDDASTLYECFQRGLRLSASRPCMGYRPMTDGVAGDYVWQTYAEVWERVQNFGSGVKHLGLVERNSDGMPLVGHYMKNCMEWVLSEQASNAYGMVVVPLYDTLGAEAVEFILNQASITCVVCSPAETEKLISVKKNVPSMKHIVQSGDVSEDMVKRAAEAGITLHSFASVEATGKANRAEPTPPKPEDLATFCYTSGTTGNPKGAMLSHRNIVADLTGGLDQGLSVLQDDVHISYLPLAHMFERIVQAAMFIVGGSIGFYQGDTLKLMDDIRALRPTIFPSVPRLYNKIYDRILGQVNAAGGLKASLFHRALAAKTDGLRSGHLKHGLWDSLVFKKLRARLGLDRVRVMLTGSAPIGSHVMDFLRAAFGCALQEGYGQTESSAASTLTYATDYSTGHVGGPMSCNEVMLENVEDMGYLVTDTVHGAQEDGSGGTPCAGRGEICFRGPNVFMGYYKMEEKTAETIDSKGWLHSGDIGIWLPNGALKIVDRKKNIFKLAQGEYVAAEKIENVYARSPFVAQAFVYGDSLQSFLVGLIVPDQEYVEQWAPEFKGKFEEACASDKLRTAVADDLARVAAEAKLHSFEKVKNMHLDSKLWTVDDGQLTPTFKLKRPFVKKQYQAEIDRMYEEGIVLGRKKK